jgi:hypothetical protein
VAVDGHQPGEQPAAAVGLAARAGARAALAAAGNTVRRALCRVAGGDAEACAACGACAAGEAAAAHGDILENVDFREKKLYHQIHPLKLATDIGVTPIALYFVWEHRVLPALLVGFVPPLVVSLAMLKWTPDLEKLKRSAFGSYIKKHMSPIIELIRLLTLVPMAYGAWSHDSRFIVVGLVILVVAWCNGLIQQVFRTDEP